MEPEVSLLCLQDPAADHYPELEESSPYIPAQFLYDSVQCYSPIYVWILRVVVVETGRRRGQIFEPSPIDKDGWIRPLSQLAFT